MKPMKFLMKLKVILILQKLDKAEKSIKSIQSLADKIAKTELFEDDEETAYEI
jgi:hypothetical protein